MPARPVRAWTTARISRIPGRKTRTSLGHVRGHDAPLRRRWAPTGRRGAAASTAGRSGTTGRGSTPLAHLRGGARPPPVERRRHDEDPELRSEAVADVEGEGQPEIGLEVALVELIEDDDGDAVERGVSLQASGEDAVGDHLDPGGLRDPAFVTRREPDGLPDTLAEKSRHPRRSGAGRHPARLEEEHPTVVHPWLAQQPEGFNRRLSCARFSLEDRGAVPASAWRSSSMTSSTGRPVRAGWGEVGHGPEYGSGK